MEENHVLVFYFILVIVQCYFSFICYDPNSWLLRPLQSYLERNPDKAANVVANLAPEVEPFNITATPTLWIMFGVGIAIHHSLAALVSLFGYLYDSPNTFRVGISFEIGEDILQYGQMVGSLFLPPGFGPFAYLPKATWLFPALHHALGLFAGSYAFVCLANWREVQLLTFLLLASVLPGFLNKPLEICADLHKPSVYGKINIFIQLVGIGFCVYIRFFMYFPLAYSLYCRMYEERGATSANVLAVPLVLFALYSVLSVLLCLGGLVSFCKAQTFQEAADAVRRSSSRLAGTGGASDGGLTRAQSRARQMSKATPEEIEMELNHW